MSLVSLKQTEVVNGRGYEVAVDQYENVWLCLRTEGALVPLFGPVSGKTRKWDVGRNVSNDPYITAAMRHVKHVKAAG